MTILSIKDLHATVDGKEILKGIDLEMGPGEIHAIMGPNGSGKSTLSYVLAGREGYEVTKGEVLYQGKDLIELSPEERAQAGVFLAFQYPVEIPGVPTVTFLKQAMNSVRKARGEKELDAFEFKKIMDARLKELSIVNDMVRRALNAGFSGGEKKRMEVLQMAMLEPSLAILDETDSGLDIDALKTVADGVNALRSPDRSMLVITHYQRLLDYIVPDHVHVLAGGRIIRSGDKSLALELEEKGYADIVAAAA
ncbi:MAG: Fe-S cluster assembly ATPase SufC [Alphaproteobacteria bacterium]|jgi:Fe-S cluster assembly ATP-binding protein|nr:Fe-S cluster assembly ATPase SufC [Rhodospirillaceae bacterium]MDG2482285.1 Fe-S cluster assembly ATPase SufC [Alphaproteobacteria bacterium]MBT6204050.1 Fe-S cluster assembly ATPase SufC [Rhodospirillaceae bacterium]MBT6509000.1 Fe-S cluster assembly ATPase SufC [Rhodospirillaceae bacterium]MBT7615086.1 Fe-S cluster assembly ATPase SufC [Rhodospirillaceae bacterium]